MTKNLESKLELQINGIDKRVENMQEMFNKHIEEIKKNQYIINNAITEHKSTLGGINSRITETEDRISEVEDTMLEKKNEREKKIIKGNEENLRDLWENVKCPIIRIIGVPEEENKQTEKAIRKYFRR